MEKQDVLLASDMRLSRLHTGRRELCSLRLLGPSGQREGFSMQQKLMQGCVCKFAVVVERHKIEANIALARGRSETAGKHLCC